jgi:NAD(P)-dependent dehydrogenase (short-subunit alcohol dehydrogenase family)
MFVTGASRGIGLGLVKQLLQVGEKYKVIATCRDPSNAPNLTALKGVYSDERLVVLPLDVTSSESHKNLKDNVVERGVSSIDILIANAGILIREDNSPLHTTSDQITTVFQTNVIGAMLTLQTFSDLTIASPTRLFVVISSIMGSITQTAQTGGTASYRMSKAAINSYAATLSAEWAVKNAGCKVLCVHPGWVQTDMGSEKAPLSVDGSVQDIETLLSAASSYQLRSSPTAAVTVPTPYQPFVEKLQKFNCVFVKHDGTLLDW